MCLNGSIIKVMLMCAKFNIFEKYDKNCCDKKHGNFVWFFQKFAHEWTLSFSVSKEKEEKMIHYFLMLI
jgi:hypothetical protein